MGRFTEMLPAVKYLLRTDFEMFCPYHMVTVYVSYTLESAGNSVDLRSDELDESQKRCIGCHEAFLA